MVDFLNMKYKIKHGKVGGNDSSQRGDYSVDNEVFISKRNSVAG